MSRLFRNLKLTAAMLLASFSLVMATPVAAQAPFTVTADSVSDACSGIGLTGGNCNGSGGSNKIQSVVRAVVQILSIAVGVAAVIMIIIAGMRYITSSGDAANIASAKKTLIYAIVGLVIAALAQLIVHFVLGQVA